MPSGGAATTKVNSPTLSLSLSAKDADIRDILRGIAIQNHINIVPDNDVEGRITIHLENAPFEHGLHTLLETNGFILEKKDSIYLVHKKESGKPKFIVSVVDDKLTLDVTDADIRQVLREVAKQSKTDIVMEPNVTGKVTAHLTDVSLETGLQSFLIANDFLVHQDGGNGGIYRVSRMSDQQGASFFVFFSKGVFTIDVKSAPLEKIVQEVADQAKVNLVTVGTLQGTLSVRLTGVDVNTALRYIATAAGYEYKVKDGIYLVGDSRMRQGQPNPLLEQRVFWLKHIDAFETTTEVFRGEEVPLQLGGFVRRSFNQIDTGITLNITPWVGSAGEIAMALKTEIRDADKVTARESRIANRSTDTVIRVADGGIVVIGGLIQQKEATQQRKVPVLGSIPLMGHLFKSSNTTTNDTDLKNPTAILDLNQQTVMAHVGEFVGEIRILEIKPRSVRLVQKGKVKQLEIWPPLRLSLGSSIPQE